MNFGFFIQAFNDIFERVRVPIVMVKLNTRILMVILWIINNTIWVRRDKYPLINDRVIGNKMMSIRCPIHKL